MNFNEIVNTLFNGQVMLQAVPTLLTVGLPNTLIFSIASGVIGTVLGLLLATMGVSRFWLWRWIARIYTDIFRGLPAILVIVIIGVGLASALRPIFGRSPYALGILALSLMAAAYIGEIFRSGIQSVDKGQMEASRALGFSYGASMRLIITPQGIRRVLPALVNQFIILIKDSSLVFYLGVMTGQREIFRIGNDTAATSGNYSAVVAGGILYLVLTIPLTHLVNYIDKRLRTGRPEKQLDSTVELPTAEAKA